MPAIALNRSNAWEFWKAGRVAATNVDNLGVDAPGTTPILANLAVKHGHNAIRFWLNWGVTSNGDYTLRPEDWQVIALNGWTSSTFTTRTANEAQKITIIMVRDQVQRVLDRCHALGMGVILTGDFLSSQNGPLWSATEGAGLHGQLALFWQKTIAAFGNHPALIGIDLLNEPDPTRKIPLAQARDVSRIDCWPRLAQYLIDKIREAETSSAQRLPLIVEGTLGYGLTLFTNPNDANDKSFLLRDYSVGSNNGPNANTADDRLVYSSHAYLPGWVAGQGVNEGDYLALGSVYPVSSTSSQYILAREYVIKDGVETAVEQDFNTWNGWDGWDANFTAEIQLRQWGLPVFMGEFGSIQPKLAGVYPPNPNRSADFQWVTNAKPVTGTSIPPNLFPVREVTSITYDQSDNTYILGLDNITGNFQPTKVLSRAQVEKDKPAQTPDFTNYTVNSRGCPAYNGVEVPVAGWRLNWFATENLTATMWMVGANGAPATTQPAFAHIPVTLVGGERWVKVSVSGLTPTQRGTPDASGRYPVVAVINYATSRTTAEIEQSRLAMAKDMLKTWQRHGFSWAYFTEDVDFTGFIGWRATPEIRALLTKAARGDVIV